MLHSAHLCACASAREINVAATTLQWRGCRHGDLKRHVSGIESILAATEVLCTRSLLHGSYMRMMKQRSTVVSSVPAFSCFTTHMQLLLVVPQLRYSIEGLFSLNPDRHAHDTSARHKKVLSARVCDCRSPIHRKLRYTPTLPGGCLDSLQPANVHSRAPGLSSRKVRNNKSVAARWLVHPACCFHTVTMGTCGLISLLKILPTALQSCVGTPWHGAPGCKYGGALFSSGHTLFQCRKDEGQ